MLESKTCKAWSFPVALYVCITETDRCIHMFNERVEQMSNYLVVRKFYNFV